MVYNYISQKGISTNDANKGNAGKAIGAAAVARQVGRGAESSGLQRVGGARRRVDLRLLIK